MGRIIVRNLGKAYKQYPSRWARLSEWIIPYRKPRHVLKWVLQDLNFEVHPGEAFAIVGINGAGKSTLLKMISGTTQPTTGSVTITGRVAALLELGMGFHPDFTGRQNVLMSGQLLGYSSEEISELMSAIETFAEIGDYIDQPVRVYSSGMQVRLAFSVATAIRPSVLIVDEALAVGDIAFQRKCFARIEEFRKLGTTLLFVSHDLETIKKLCDKAVFLNQGSIQCQGAPKAVCAEYEKVIFGVECPSDGAVEVNACKYDGALSVSACEEYGDSAVVICGYRIEDSEGNKANVFSGGSRIIITYTLFFNKEVMDPIVGMMLKTREGVCIYYIDTKILRLHPGGFGAGQKCDVKIVLENNLTPGSYFLNFSIRTEMGDKQAVHHRMLDAAIITVNPRHAGKYPGGLTDLDAKVNFLR